MLLESDATENSQNKKKMSIPVITCIWLNTKITATVGTLAKKITVCTPIKLTEDPALTKPSFKMCPSYRDEEILEGKTQGKKRCI